MQPPKRVYFRRDRTQKVKEISGYQKGHRLPERVDSYAKKYLGDIAQNDLKAEMDATFNLLREYFGYKRKQMESSISPEGNAVIHTPAFDYAVTMLLDDADPTRAIVRRELTPDDLTCLKHPYFGSVFPQGFDTLRADWIEPLDIIEIFDELEDDPIPGTKLKIGSDNSFFELTIEGFAGFVRLEPKLLSVGGSGAGAAVLMDQFLMFQKRFQREAN